MDAMEKLHRMLEKRGVGTYKHEAPAAVCLAFFDGNRWHDCWESTGGEVNVTFSMTPEQAIAATLGSNNCTNNCTNSERTRTCQKVYLVETSDDLIESWYPIGVYLNSKTAEDCADTLRGEVDGIRQFARVVELKVMTNG